MHEAAREPRECRRPTCTNHAGEQDRDDYRSKKFCSIQCETKFEHVRDDARDARAEAAERHEAER